MADINTLAPAQSPGEMREEWPPELGSTWNLREPVVVKGHGETNGKPWVYYHHREIEVSMPRAMFLDSFAPVAAAIRAELDAAGGKGDGENTNG